MLILHDKLKKMFFYERDLEVYIGSLFAGANFRCLQNFFLEKTQTMQ